MSSPSSRKVVLSFMAHPDDTEFHCTGTLIRLIGLGWEVHICAASPGDCGSATLPPDEIAAIRREEGAAAAAAIGAKFHCLEERDVSIVFDKATSRKAVDLFRGINPTLVMTHPREDYMLDHEQVHLLARQAAFAFPIPNASKIPVPDGAALPHLYYIDPLEGVDPLGRPVTPTTYVAITDQMEKKAEALACHVSQREWLRAHHGMDEYIEAMKRHSRMRGLQSGAEYAEAFVQHRGHAFPRNDLLAELFGA